MRARLERLLYIVAALTLAWDGYDVVRLVYHARGFGVAGLTFCAFALLALEFAERALKSYAASLSGGPLGGTAT